MAYGNAIRAAGALLFLLCAAACSPSATDTPALNEVKKNYAKIEKQNQQYNAFISTDRAQAMRHAKAADAMQDAPLRGMTLAVKDNIFTRDFATTGGTPALADFRPNKDAEVVAQLRQAGAVVVGKTNLHELAFGITNNNYAYGPVHNAYRKDYFSGGSSGGTAVAVALGFARAGLGTDTGGSCRIPAALNNIVGFRPTTGRYSADGLIKISTTRDTVGIMAKTVDDVILLDGVLSGDSQAKNTDGNKPIRLGVPKVFYQNIDPQVESVVRAALDKISASGVELVPQDLPGLFALNEKVSFPIVLYETGQLLPAFLQENAIQKSAQELVADIASPDVKQTIKNTLQGVIPEAVYMQARDTHRPALQKMLADYFAKNNLDAMVLPTTPLAAQPIAGSDEMVMLNGKRVPTFPTFIRNVDPSSNAGIPGISIPAGFTEDGLPVGVELEGPRGSDAKLLGIAKKLAGVIGVKEPQKNRQ